MTDRETGYLRAYVMPKIAEVVGFTGELDKDQAKAKTQLQEFIKQSPEAQEKAREYMKGRKDEYVEKINMVYSYGTFDDNKPKDKKYKNSSNEEKAELYEQFFLNNKDVYSGLHAAINTLLIADLTNERTMALNSLAVAQSVKDGKKVDSVETMVSGVELMSKLGTQDPTPDAAGKYSNAQRTSINLFRGAVDNDLYGNESYARERRVYDYMDEDVPDIENKFRFNTAKAVDYEAMLAETVAIKKQAMEMMVGPTTKGQQADFLKGMAVIAEYTSDSINSVEKSGINEYSAKLDAKINFKKAGFEIK